MKLHVFLSPVQTGVLLFILGSAFVGHAQTLQAPFSSTRDYGMLGVIGDPQVSSALFNNPAGMSRSFVYAAEGQYVRSAQRQLNVLGGSVVDSKTQPAMAVGLAYGYGFTDESAEFDIESHDARLAISKPLVPKHVFAGLGFRYVREKVSSGDFSETLDGFTLDPGLLFVITETFSVGAVGQNLLRVDGLPRRAGGGIAVGAQSFVLDGDVLMDFDTHPDGNKVIYRTGVEFLAGDTVPLRAGYEANTATDSQWFACGLGFMQTEGIRGSQLNLSYKQRLDVSDIYTFTAGLTMFL